MIPLSAEITNFADGELKVGLRDDVRECSVFIICDTKPPAENIVETCLLADAARHASASKITLVFPYLAYNRQDRKDRPRMALSSEVVIDILKRNADRIILLDLHSEATRGFFRPAIDDHLFGSAIIIPRLKKLLKETDFVIASPDAGGTARARKYAQHLGRGDYVVFSKERSGDNTINEAGVTIIGDVRNKVVVLVDDIIDTGGTMIADAKAAKEAGATHVIGCGTHGLFSNGALDRLADSPIDHVIVTDSAVRTKLKQLGTLKVDVLPTAPLLANAIRRVHVGESLSDLIL
jgi:ribose-phosphate pyrophosphokinase